MLERLVIAMLVAGLLGCAEDLPHEPQPEIVRALWNPVTGTLPTPTDLVRNDDAEQLDLPLDDDLPEAEKEFRRYLNSLDGYPLQTTLTVPLSGAISEGGLRGSLVVLDRTTEEAVRVVSSVSDDGTTIKAFPPQEDATSSFQPGHEYAFGLRGYDGGVHGAEGEPVVADAPFFFVRSDEPLTEHPSAVPGEGRVEKRETAESLEEVRLSFRPLLDAMAQRGIPRREVAVVSEFTTTARPSIWFDSTAGEIPLPNGLLRDPSTGELQLPISEEDTEEEKELKHELSTYDGFSTSAALVLKATKPVDAPSVNAETLRLFRLHEDGSFEEVVDVERGVLDDPHRFWIAPKLTLEHNAWYVYVATRHVTSSSGIPNEPQPLAALLRSDAPLLEDGASQVGALNDETAARLEPLRKRAKPVVDWLADQGTSRLDVSAVVPFRTTSSVEELLELRASLYEENVSSSVRNVVVKTPNERGLPLVLNDVETVVTGDMPILDYLDPRTRRFREDGVGQENAASFVLTIPEGYSKGDPIPVVLFGHGLMTSRELVYMIANKLAEAGYAAFSFDLPYHGRRSVCLRDDTGCLDGSTCNEFGQCVNPDGSKEPLAKISSPFPDGPEWPTTTGLAFIEVDNIVGSRDHFAQSITDLCQAVRVIEGTDWASAAEGWTIDGDDTVYLGMSLGGILGAALSGVEPKLEDFALNVPGGDLYRIFKDSKAFETTFQGALDNRDIELGTDAAFDFENGLRWLLDPVDPLNIAHHAVLDPVTYVDPVDGQEKTAAEKRVMIQMAQGDIVVPNSSTRVLSERMGVPIREYTPAELSLFDSNHGFLFDPFSLEGTRARNDIVEFFDAR